MLSLTRVLVSALALAYASALANASPAVHLVRAVNKTRELSIRDSPIPGRQVVDARFQSYSIEFSYMADYAGNHSHPNAFSIRMLENLANISGAYPIIRAGGSTQNRAIWVQNQTQGIIPTYATPGADQPSGLTIGPNFLQSFQTFPTGTQYIFGLSFQSGTTGHNQTLMEAIPAAETLGDSLYAMEIGNEIDGFPCGRRPCNWTVQDYVNEWLGLANQIDDTVGSSGKYTEPLFQAGAFQAPRHVNNFTVFDAQSIIHDGIDSTGKAKTVSDHDYMGAACPDRTSIATLAGNLLNHHHMTSLMWYHEFLSNYTIANSNASYVIGETNSISCQGQKNISDVFGASLWATDYVLYVATLNVERLYFHMGTPYRYSAWQPIKVNSTVAQPKALYYSNLFTSTALAGGNKQVEVVVNETSFTAYAIYEAAATATSARRTATTLGSTDIQANCEADTTAQLRHVAVINLQIWNYTQPAADRPYNIVNIPLPSSVKATTTASVRFLSAPGADSDTGLTWAGQSVDLSGNLVGQQVVQKLQTQSANGTSYVQVEIGASQALLVSFG